jgi:hypothetical protein
MILFFCFVVFFFITIVSLLLGTFIFSTTGEVSAERYEIYLTKVDGSREGLVALDHVLAQSNSGSYEITLSGRFSS